MSHTRLLTMGLYWIRPATFAAYDNVNVAFIKKDLPDVVTRLALGAKITGEQFLANTETLQSWLASSSTPYNKICELSYAAWVDALGTRTRTITLRGNVTDAPLAEVAEIAEEPDDPYDVTSIREDGCFLAEDELQPMLRTTPIERTWSSRALPVPVRPGSPADSAGRCATNVTPVASRSSSSIPHSPTRGLRSRMAPLDQ